MWSHRVLSRDLSYRLRIIRTSHTGTLNDAIVLRHFKGPFHWKVALVRSTLGGKISLEKSVSQVLSDNPWQANPAITKQADTQVCSRMLLQQTDERESSTPETSTTSRLRSCCCQSIWKDARNNQETTTREISERMREANANSNEKGDLLKPLETKNWKVRETVR